MLHKRNAARNHQRGRNGSVGSALEPVGVTEFYRVLPGFFSLSHFDLESRGFYRVSSPPPSVFPVLLVPALPGRLQRKRRRRRRKRRRRRRRRRKRRRRNARGRLALGPISITDEHLPDGSCKQRPGTGEKRKKNKKNEHKRKTPSNQQNNKKTPKPAGTRSALPSFVTGFPTNPHPLPCERYQSIMIVVTVQNGG